MLAYGSTRDTFDIDILLAPDPEHWWKLLTLPSLLGLYPPIHGIEAWAMPAFRDLHHRPDSALVFQCNGNSVGRPRLDAILELASPLDVREIISRSVILSSDDNSEIQFRVATRADLLAMKRQAVAHPDRPASKRKIDEQDIRVLEAA